MIELNIVLDESTEQGEAVAYVTNPTDWEKTVALKFKDLLQSEVTQHYKEVNVAFVIDDNAGKK